MNEKLNTTTEVNIDNNEIDVDPVQGLKKTVIPAITEQERQNLREEAGSTNSLRLPSILDGKRPAYTSNYTERNIRWNE
jgi:hypothetical protein